MNDFAITADPGPFVLEEGRAELKLTVNVANMTANGLRVRVVPKALGGTQLSWLSVNEPLERDFAVQESHQFLVSIRASAGVAAGTYRFRLDAVSVAKPNTIFTVGPEILFEVKPNTPLPKPKPFNWFWVVVGAAVVIAGICVWLLWPKGIIVPDVTGQTLESANKALTNLQLIVDKTYQTTGTNAPNTVIDQDPHGGTRAKTNTTVILIIKQPPAPIKVEPIKGGPGPVVAPPILHKPGVMVPR